jgi:putative addiction module killer protein
MKVEITEYLTKNGKSPFSDWFKKLNSEAAAKITTALYRIEQGNFSNVENVGAGVAEYKINFGPGYRIYFAQINNILIILLGGGTKKRQSDDIKNAKQHWQDYKNRRFN